MQNARPPALPLAPDPLTDTVPLLIRVHPLFAEWVRNEARRRRRTLGYVLHEEALGVARARDPRIPAPVRVPRGPPPK